MLGTPSTVATVSGEAFYYIAQRAEQSVAFMNPKVTSQRVVAVYFDKNRRVERIANYGLKDGRDKVRTSNPEPANVPLAPLQPPPGLREPEAFAIVDLPGHGPPNEDIGQRSTFNA